MSYDKSQYKLLIMNALQHLSKLLKDHHKSRSDGVTELTLAQYIDQALSIEKQEQKENKEEKPIHIIHTRTIIKERERDDDDYRESDMF